MSCITDKDELRSTTANKHDNTNHRLRHGRRPFAAYDFSTSQLLHSDLTQTQEHTRRQCWKQFKLTCDIAHSTVTLHKCQWLAGHSGNRIGHFNKVQLCRAQLAVALRLQMFA